MPFNVNYYAWNNSTAAYVASDSANHAITVRANGVDQSGLAITEIGGGQYQIVLTDAQLPEGSQFSVRGSSSTANVSIHGDLGVRPRTPASVVDANVVQVAASAVSGIAEFRADTNRFKLSGGTRSHNLGPFFQRLFRENCQVFYFGDSLVAEGSQQWPSIPTFIRRAFENVTGKQIAGCRFVPFADWKFNKFASSLHSTLQQGATIPGTTITTTGQALHIDVDGRANGIVAAKWVFDNEFGSPLRLPFITPPWISPPFNLAFTVHNHAAALQGLNLRDLPGATQTLSFHDGSPSEAVETVTVSRSPNFGDGPSYGYTEQFQLNGPANGNQSNDGKSITLYDIALYLNGWVPNASPGLFQCGVEADGSDSIYNHLPAGFESAFTGATYTDAALQGKMNPGGDAIAPNTFVVQIVNRFAPTQGPFNRRMTSAQFDRVVADWIAVFNRWSTIAEAAGTPKQQQRWLFVSPWPTFATANSDSIEAGIVDWSAALRAAVRKMGTTASFLDMQDILREKLGTASQWQADFLSDGIHPNFEYVDDPDGDRSLCDFWGRTALAAIQEMEGVLDPLVESDAATAAEGGSTSGGSVDESAIAAAVWSHPTRTLSAFGFDVGVSAASVSAIAAACDVAILNQGDGVDVLKALADLIAQDWVAGDASPLAIVSALVQSDDWSDLVDATEDAKSAAEQIATGLTAARLGKLDRDLAHAGDAATYHATTLDATQTQAAAAAAIAAYDPPTRSEATEDKQAILDRGNTAWLTGSGSGGGGGGTSGPLIYTVTVEETNQTPIENALVRLRRSGQSGSVRTNAQGQAQFAIDAASWEIAVWAAGFENTVQSQNIAADGSITITLDPLIIPTASDSDQCAVAVDVENQYTEPVEAACVRAYPTTSPLLASDALVIPTQGSYPTDANGRAVLTLFRTVEYRIEVTFGNATKSLKFTVPDQATAVATLTV
ncbi:MAG: carboxypeptidase-like regulatory domain-containing protein [Planctomycetota bacterium]